jgi:hypothetical protein
MVEKRHLDLIPTGVEEGTATVSCLSASLAQPPLYAKLL